MNKQGHIYNILKSIYSECFANIIYLCNTAFLTLKSLGTNEKFWFRHEQLGLCLYKKSRSKTAGEDWSEKIAAELCQLLKLPRSCLCWLNILEIVSQNDTFQLLQRIPENRISAIAI